MTKTTKIKIKYPCPVSHCKTDLSKNGLSQAQTGENTFNVYIDEDGFLAYDEAEFYDDGGTCYFYCRTCGNELPKEYQNDEIIIKILKYGNE